MQKLLVLFFFITLAACDKKTERQAPTHPAGSKEKEPAQISEVEVTQIDPQYIDSIFLDSGVLQIQNSLPRGGMTYTDIMGNEYRYVVFWTAIANLSEEEMEFSINLSGKPITLPSAPDTYFQLIIPKEQMNPEKAPQPNYGFTQLKYELDQGLGNASGWEQTLAPETASMFYVVAVSNKGVNGVVRAGLQVEGDSLYYRINEVVIPVGRLE